MARKLTGESGLEACVDGEGDWATGEDEAWRHVAVGDGEVSVRVEIVNRYLRNVHISSSPDHRFTVSPFQSTRYESSPTPNPSRGEGL